LKDRNRIFLADDNPLVLWGVHNLLVAESDFAIVGEATSGPDALTKICEIVPNLAILDNSLPGMTGIQLAARLAEVMPELLVVMLTLHEDRAYLVQAFRAGARGYVVKRTAAEHLVPAVRLVLSGQTFVDPVFATRPLDRPVTRAAWVATDALSEPEISVLKLSAQGLTNREISLRLADDLSAIERIRTSGLGKLEISTRAELLRYAAQCGWPVDA
jgi:DNA-binding NarL/FixJ family response regulator